MSFSDGGLSTWQAAQEMELLVTEISELVNKSVGGDVPFALVMWGSDGPRRDVAVLGRHASNADVERALHGVLDSMPRPKAVSH